MSTPNNAPSVTDMRFERSEMLFVAELYGYPNHPFRVVDDEEMSELSESIRVNGVREPLLVRSNPSGEGGYQIISGHRRKRAAELCGAAAVPCIVKPMSDDEAAITMTESNLKHRQKLLHSEKAWAYRIQLEAMKRQGKRSDLTSTQVVSKLRSNEELGQAVGDSREKIRRYIRLTYLIPPLLERVDMRDDYGDALAFGVGVLLSYLTEQEQKLLDYHITLRRYFLSIRQAQTLKELSEKRELTEDAMLDALEDNSKADREPRLIFYQKEVSRYFPPGTSGEDARKINLELLENYRRRWLRQQKKESTNTIEEIDNGTDYGERSDYEDSGGDAGY